MAVKHRQAHGIGLAIGAVVAAYRHSSDKRDVSHQRSIDM